MAMKQRADHPAYDHCYHFVGATKYRKDLFTTSEMRESLKNIFIVTTEKLEDTTLIACTIAYNHVHILLRSTLPPSKIGQALFGASSRLMRQQYPILIESIESGLWGGKSWVPIRDEDHLNNCIFYINRHQPDNTKV